MLDPSILKELRTIVGSDHLFTSPEELAVYSYDATRVSSLPWAVARPATALEVSRIVQLANKHRFPVIPRGAGTGMSGGSVPAKGGVVLSFERMDLILDIDVLNRIAIVQPGVITGDLHAAVEAKGLFYPPDPASSGFCTIGGNVAECAGGLRAVKYGVTRDYVLGLEVVLPTGEIIRTGSRTHKSVAGYDLTRLIVGSEGTLGIATEIVLRLIPAPESIRTLAAFFLDAGGALAVLPMITTAGILPRALEFVDQGALRAAEQHLGWELSDGTAAMLLIETDGSMTSARAEITRTEEFCAAAGAVKVVRADEPGERDRLWKLRRSISPALYALKPGKLNEDIVVPLSRIADILGEINSIAKKHDLLIVNFGHAGDGNIHVNVMYDDGERTRAESAVSAILTAVVRMQGSISGEHGIGLSKAQYLPLETGDEAITVMKKIKQALDPNNIMNPGKIFLSAERGVRSAE
ncbi:MAG: FAD-binding protein [Nitrospirota bacterium]|nr:FAD-binding protein [Nitrospirota bacterium]